MGPVESEMTSRNQESWRQGKSIEAVWGPGSFGCTDNKGGGQNSSWNSSSSGGSSSWNDGGGSQNSSWNGGGGESQKDKKEVWAAGDNRNNESWQEALLRSVCK